MLSSLPGVRASPPPLLAHLSSRRAALVLLLSLVLFLLSLLLFAATFYLRSGAQPRSPGGVEWFADVHSAVAVSEANSSAAPTSSLTPSSLAKLLAIPSLSSASFSLSSLSPPSTARRPSVPHPPTAPRAPPPDIGDPAKARLPLAEDETQLLQSLVQQRKRERDRRTQLEKGEERGEGAHADDAALDGGHLHEWSAAHNHSHEVLTEVQLARQRRQEEEDAASLVQCQRMQSELGIVVGSSWGKASEDQKQDWWQRDCDAVLLLKDYRAFIEQHPELYDPVILPPMRPAAPNRSSDLPVIAICVSTTTRFLDIQSIEQLTLFTSLLPSIVDSVEEGFEYWLYLSYDVGDPFLDRESSREAIRRWFDDRLIGPLSSRGIAARLQLEVYDNVMKKPGPAFNYLTQLAFIDGADWLYRINDDSYFMTPFASAFVAALSGLGPPFGVAGPVCNEGAQGILTHDFTHRTHHLVMPHHYPPPLSDWWMDDWITRVYGQRRTVRVQEVVVKHLVKQHGTRYNIDLKHKLLLGTEVEKGRRHIERYLAQHHMDAQLLAYQTDEFKFYV